MDPIPINLTFASLLTPPGVVAAAAIVTGLVALIRNVFAQLDISGALLAFVLTAVLYVLTGIAVGVSTLDGALLVFLAWLSAATSSVGIHSTTTHVQAARAGES